MEHQYIRDLHIGPMQMDENQDGQFAVWFRFYPKEVDEVSCKLNLNPNPDETHRQIGKQLLHLMNGVRASKNPEKFMRTHGDRKYED